MRWFAVEVKEILENAEDDAVGDQRWFDQGDGGAERFPRAAFENGKRPD